MSRSNRSPFIIPLALVILGVVLLLSNFLLIETVDVLRFWPLLLVGIGLLVLIKGDLAFTWQSQSFGITRGNVESATLEASSGELDIKVRALRREGRLIAGRYTARSRPTLSVRGTHARLSMQRGRSWLLSLADWEVGLARDLPWNLLFSSYLGEIDVDLRGLNVERAHIASGIGDVHIIVSDVASGGLFGGSTFGNVTLEVPLDVATIIQVQAGPLARVKVDERRFILLEPGVYATLDYQDNPTPLQARVGSTFGTISLT